MMSLFVLAVCAAAPMDIASATISGDTCGYPIPVFCNASVSPTSAAPGTSFAITASSTSAIIPLFLIFIAVVAPSGATYACQFIGSADTPPCHGLIITAGASSCTIPFGEAGTVTSTGSISGCSGSNTASWALLSVPFTPAELYLNCANGAVLLPSGSTAGGVGSTSQIGPYTVVACWSPLPDSAGYYATTTFTVSPAVATGVPQFPLGLLALFAVMVPALLILRKSVPLPKRSV
jgi:hypothetical protein